MLTDPYRPIVLTDPYRPIGRANGVAMQEGYITGGYNALNQPVLMWGKYFNGTSDWMYFGFDPLGRCVKRWKGPLVDGHSQPSGSNPATYFYYDGWNLVQEGPSASVADRIYVHGGRVDEIVASRVSGTWYNHHFDGQGHCIMLTDTNGGLVEQYDFDAFGYPYFYTASGSRLATLHTRFLFTGREWLNELRLYDFRNRMYQPELGRFLQPDPKQFTAGDYNLYRYCHIDPVNKSDPFGLVPPGEGLLDLPRTTVQEMKEAMKENLKNTETKPAYGPDGKPVKQEFRTTHFTNGSKVVTPGGYHPPGSKPSAGLKDPFKGGRRPDWDTHSHISVSGRPINNDRPAADYLRVPSGTQSATGGPMYIYVPSATRGGEGGLFRVEGSHLINDATGQEAPH